MSNKIGFNNFKAFGPKMQYFSNKPITLVFGPNSVGKSSFLHSQLYYEYLKRSTFPQRNDFSAINLISSHFAGDNLDLGGIKNFIHKHLESKEIVYEEIYTDIDEIGDFFSENFKDILELEKKGVFEYVQQLINNDNFYELYNDRVSKYKIKSGKYHIVSTLKKNFKDQLEQEQFYSLFVKTYKLEDNESTKKIYFDTFNNNENLSSIVFRDDGEELDYFDLYLLFILEIFIHLSFTEDSFKELVCSSDDFTLFKTRISQSLEFYQYLVNINKFKISNTISKDKNLITNIFINDEPIFEINYSTNFYKPNEIEYSFYGSDFFKLSMSYISGPQGIGIFDNIDKTVKSKKINIHIESSNNIDLIFSSPLLLVNSSMSEIFFHPIFKNIIYKSIKLDSSNMQYFGPLRFWPERYEYFKENLSTFSNEKNKDEFYLKEFLNEMSNIKFNNLYRFKILKSIIALLLILSNKKFYKSCKSEMMKIINSPMMINASNHFRKNKKSLKGSYSSSKMWENLANSEEIQNKINYWLADNKKLKTPYKISIEKSSIKVNFVKKLFGFKDKIQYFIRFLDKNKNTEVTSKDIGLGISQMLPLLISSISSKNTKHYIEQPELHLHPAIQMELMDEFIKSKNENKNQFIMESHSEHMLLRIMKRIKQTQNGTLEDESLILTPEDVCLLYVDNDGEQTYIQELRLSKNGKLLDHWPNGFFEEGYKERFF